jgi:hypothetical protein
MKIFNARPCFSVFFIARANQKITNLALGHQSRRIHGGINFDVSEIIARLIFFM